ncbi:MAG: phosphatase PAP2 family protein, partial [Acidimicrobiales bacterium]
MARWSGEIITEPWTVINNEYIASKPKDPPMSGRNLSYTQAAMYDALVAAYHWKNVYQRSAPEGVDTLVDAGDLPSYPSEHAAIAGAASRVLAHLYPNQPGPRLEELAEEAADSRVAAGVNTRSDVEAGLTLGRAIAGLVIAKADADGSTAVWDGKRPAGIGNGPTYWEPPPGSVGKPIQPLAGNWKTWVLSSGSALRGDLPPPPAYNSAEFKSSAEALVNIKNNLTDEQKRIAKFWEGAAGSALPAGILNQVVLCQLKGGVAKGTTPPECDTSVPNRMQGSKLAAPEATRVFALINIAMADAGGAVWDAKFVYWYPRPQPAISDSGVQPGWEPHLPTPLFPAYPSGSA